MNIDKFMVLEAEIIGKIARESDKLNRETGHGQSFCRGYLEGLEWVSEQIAEIRNAAPLTEGE